MAQRFEGFPVVEEAANQPWVEALNFRQRKEREEIRNNAIGLGEAKARELLEEISGFENVPGDAIGYVAYRLSLRRYEGYEEGVQHGMDMASEIHAAERTQAALFQHNVLNIPS